jgi:ubiquinone/menaquinone biosynthesis C-methylase UbiE
MNEADSVRMLYNRKALEWRRKYDADGPLAYRIAAFDAQVRSQVPPKARVLDLGCGTGHLAFHLTGGGYDVTACDIAERMLEEARGAFPAAKVDWRLLATHWTRLPFEDASFDGIVSSSVFEYLENPRLVFSECVRVLRPGGTLLMSVPNLASPARRLERALQVVFKPIARLSGGRLPARLKSYLDYLSLSQNRFAVAAWDAIAREAGLDSVDCRPLGTAMAGSPIGQFPLLMLTYRRREGVS